MCVEQPAGQKRSGPCSGEGPCRLHVGQSLALGGTIRHSYGERHKGQGRRGGAPGPSCLLARLLATGRAGARGGAGGQLCGREEGSFAVQSCCGCLDLLPATTRFTPDLSNKVASLSTGRNQSRTVVASLSSTGVSQGLPSYRRPRYEESATKRGHLEPI